MMPPSIERLYLWGMMAAGKTTAMRYLQDVWGLEGVDTDQLIEARTGQTIARIFERQGEIEFRRLEYQCLREWIPASARIIATGGGMPCHHDNDDWMLNAGLVIWLDVPLPSLRKRLAVDDRIRPIFDRYRPPDGQEEFMALYQARRSRYAKAHFRLSGDDVAMLPGLAGIVA